jgi:hypothetical protein
MNGIASNTILRKIVFTLSHDFGIGRVEGSNEEKSIKKNRNKNKAISPKPIISFKTVIP